MWSSQSTDHRRGLPERWDVIDELCPSGIKLDPFGVALVDRAIHNPAPFAAESAPCGPLVRSSGINDILEEPCPHHNLVEDSR